ncbi:Hypothetical protein A7982_06523 [Minicystis rosea]|nr:Hypothetical protein A7982_06523 [Minicystis rosea]
MKRRHRTWLLWVSAVAVVLPAIALIPVLISASTLAGPTTDGILPYRRLCEVRREAHCIRGDALEDTLLTGLGIGIGPFLLIALPILLILGNWGKRTGALVHQPSGHVFTYTYDSGEKPPPLLLELARWGLGLLLLLPFARPRRDQGVAVSTLRHTGQ